MIFSVLKINWNVIIIVKISIVIVVIIIIINISNIIPLLLDLANKMEPILTEDG